MSLETIWCDLKTCKLNYDCGHGNGHCLDPTNADKCPYYKLLSSESQRDNERLTDDDFETIRIHLSAFKERLCNQHRWEEAEEYQRIIDRFMRFASAEGEG